MSKFYELMSHYFYLLLVVLSVGALLWGLRHDFKKESNLDELQYITATLTSVSHGCIGCHGKQSSKEVTVYTQWGSFKWKGFESTYLDPHVKVKLFNSQKSKLNMVSTAYASSYSGSGNHPVGIQYPQGNQEYRVSPLPPIVIPYGYIECESCHIAVDVAENDHGKLVVDASQLCLSCHIK